MQTRTQSKTQAEGRTRADAQDKRRTRTGCLTCRARRVKCDEQRPSCQRCTSANVECAGYQRKRHIKVHPTRPQDVAELTDPDVSADNINGDGSSSLPIHYAHHPAQPSPSYESLFCLRSDGLPMVGFPNQPNTSQRPCSSARVLLGYHQYLFRTSSVIFPPEHQFFWRQGLCQEAWGSDHLFLAIVALGVIHRAQLLCDTPSAWDLSRGEDTQVKANQMYSQALHQLSYELQQPRGPSYVPPVTCILLAYFESFMGNITAAFGHATSAEYLLTSAMKEANPPTELQFAVIQAGLQPLWRSLHIAVPHLLYTTSMRRNQLGHFQGIPNGKIDGSQSSFQLLHTLLDIASSHSDVESMIWGHMPLWLESMSELRIRQVQASLNNWAKTHQPILCQFSSNKNGLPRTSDELDSRYPLPPTPLTPAMSSIVSPASALYYFFMGRTMWALALLADDHAQLHEQLAYAYFYEALRIAQFLISNRTTPPIAHSRYVACETMEPGLLRMLHMIGQCSPGSSQLRWIAQLMRGLNNEGLAHGCVLADSLDAVHSFEVDNGPLSTPEQDHRYCPPLRRVVSILIPEADNGGFQCYYARRDHRVDAGVDSSMGFYQLGVTRLGYAPRSPSNAQTAGSNTPEGDATARRESKPLTWDWLRSLPVMQGWQRRCESGQFSLDQALQDHMNGGHLYPLLSNTALESVDESAR